MKLLRYLSLLLPFFLAACGNSQTPPGGAPDTAPVQRLAAAEAVEGLDAARVVDVRTASEFAAGHLDGALHLDVSAPDFAARVDTLDREATYYLYCRSGARSQRAAEQMRALGFTEVYNVGGLADLAGAGAPIVR